MKIKAVIFLLAIITLSNACKKEDSGSAFEKGTVKDVENNVYQTVKIGDQWWMAENLRTRTYKNGVPLLNLSSNDTAAWSQAIVGAFCSYDNSSNSTGLLYNYLAVISDSGLAPDGWHIATDEDWKILERTLSMSEEAANKTGWRGTDQADGLRMSGGEYWNRYEDIWSTNTTGFSALAGGCRLPTGIYSTPTGLRFTGFWWTSSTFNPNESWYRYMDYKSSQIFRSHGNVNYGFSIRCVKN